VPRAAVSVATARLSEVILSVKNLKTRMIE